jgi:UDP-N-acetylglucosamine--N-acetylmuramyl-(pentapeptide) pyrophosphoryl-undecaprenol N-acetylglucosamine transferase
VRVRILLAGGGSGGSATPVLAVAQELRHRDPVCAMLYVGTRTGPETLLAGREGIPYVGVATGKLRRYWSIQNLTDPLRVARGLAESLALVRRFRPDVAFGAGGFASVPPLFAAALLRIPVLIHQQDVIPGLANRLLAPSARRITVALPQTMSRFPSDRTFLRGNPVRSSVLSGDREQGFRRLGLLPSVPLLLVTGGGTGALGLNRLVSSAAHELVGSCQILHLTGKGRGVPVPELGRRYRQREFLVEEMPDALAAASLVLSRAGMSTLSELAALGKPTVVVPMPHSHQEANAVAFAEQRAVLVLDQPSLTPERLVRTVRELLDDGARREALAQAIARIMPRDATSRLADDLSELGARRSHPETGGSSPEQ